MEYMYCFITGGLICVLGQILMDATKLLNLVLPREVFGNYWLVNDIKENLNVEEIKLFNEYNFGSYLLFEDIPVFIDSRADVYDPKFNGWEDDIFRDFINLTGASNDYEEKFEHYGITHLLIYKNSTLNKVLTLDENYNELYSDDNFIVYERLSANK